MTTDVAWVLIFGTIIKISCSLICLQRDFISNFILLAYILDTANKHSLPGFDKPFFVWSLPFGFPATIYDILAQVRIGTEKKWANFVVFSVD